MVTSTSDFEIEVTPEQLAAIDLDIMLGGSGDGLFQFPKPVPPAPTAEDLEHERIAKAEARGHGRHE